MKGYDGERCGIHTLETVKSQSNPSGKGEVTQMVLVIVAVVLSVISCLAILLMTCAQSVSSPHFQGSVSLSPNYFMLCKLNYVM